MKITWMLLGNCACCFVAGEARCALIDQLFERKLKALEHHYALECLKIPPEILNSKILQANVSIVLKYIALTCAGVWAKLNKVRLCDSFLLITFEFLLVSLCRLFPRVYFF